MDKEQDEQVLAALADSTRRQLLDILAAYGEASATALATQVTISRQAVVKHLWVLEKARLVTCNRVGREMRYTVCTQPIESTAQWMANLANDWDRKLKAIKHRAEMEE
ncbi:ArsR/SmtB family transcription factor [Bacillus salipaludis]|uniref:Metalloregulator ArsR/SmtB family transcription factor n=1 Tax=Bacillus salipaludis TaxID=2547811 RepID=A0AA90TSZ7_9BACI|nr:metalloregulator ArsR/SmtB family transcription factor [Bacillus salipaludis]MDQ6596249.1 metalloregulator ArsR/SmtB family transcription factor [Bacillus salipaludis]